MPGLHGAQAVQRLLQVRECMKYLVAARIEAMPRVGEMHAVADVFEQR